jgi:Domain of Unknown Function (DUF1206)
MAQNVSAPNAPIRRAQGKGSDFARAKQFEWLARAGIATRGVIYAIIGVLAIKLAFGSGGETTNQQGALAEIAQQPFPDKATGGVLGWPGGQILVGIAGLIIIGVGLEQGYKGITKKFCEKSRTEQMSESVKRSFTALGVFGHLARMVVFALIGYFLVRAAIDYDPDKAIGLDGALAALRDASYGLFLLGIVAAGLIGFAAYSIADARYRKV